MGMNLHLIDQRSPRGFTVAVPLHDPRTNEILRMRARLRRMRIASTDVRYALQSLIGENDSMADVVAEITSQYGSPRRPLDVIRIECHGIEGPGGGVFGLRFGQSMNTGDVAAFRGIQSLWSRFYSVVEVSHPTVESVIPRIECHGCAPVHGCNAILQALATAANASVFASNTSQEVHAGRRENPYAFEGSIFQFVPGGTGPEEFTPLP